MISHRELIKEIPSGKFHSVLMTSYSLNLYYWEIQLLRSLSRKGINYVSAIVDSDNLSEQLIKFSKAFSDKRALDFSLHGYKMNGAFHPKIQFYVGRNCILVLIGSGNLTTSGHGRNLEIWTPIMIESVKSVAYPFICEVWCYLKMLYAKLGEEANNIISTIESNCTLLPREYTSKGVDFELGYNNIRFFANRDLSIFDQCRDWIGGDRIKKITILSPFYDRRAELIKALYDEYKPDEMNIIIDETFGVIPKPSTIPSSVNVYKWDRIGKIEGKKYQKRSHAKCFFFEGETNHYMLCGSANASVAAFGLPRVKPKNQEACVGFKSEDINYFEQTGFKLEEPIAIVDLKDSYILENNNNSGNQVPLWIKEASYFYKSYNLSIENEDNDIAANVSFYSGMRKLLYGKNIIIKAGESEINGTFEDPINPLYIEISDKDGNIISNRQFVISTERIESNNPFPESNNLRKRIKDVESGRFVNGEVLRFIEQILSDTDKQLSIKSEPLSDKKDKRIVDFGNDFNTIEEYLEDGGSDVIGSRKNKIIERVNTNTSMLFDSIVSYIGKSNKEKAEEEYDNEETEDNNTSNGKETKEIKDVIYRTNKNAKSTRERVIKMFEKYFEYLEDVAYAEKPIKNKIYLSKAVERFSAAVFFLHRTFSYRFMLENNSTELQALLKLRFNPLNGKTATQYFYRLISLFALYLKKSQFAEENEYIMKRLDSRRQYSFALCLAVMAICDWQNEGSQKYKYWSSIYRLPALMNIAKVLNVDIKDVCVSDVYRCFDRSIQELDGFDRENMLKYINQNIRKMLSNEKLYPKGSLLYTDKFGYVCLYEINSYLAYPCSMAFRYNKDKKEYCPNYLFLYSKNKIYPIKPKC